MNDAVGRAMRRSNALEGFEQPNEWPSFGNRKASQTVKRAAMYQSIGMHDKEPPIMSIQGR